MNVFSWQWDVGWLDLALWSSRLKAAHPAHSQCINTVFTWKPSVGMGGGHTESVIPQDCCDRNCFYWPVMTTEGSFLLGTLFGWNLQSYPSVSCLFSPKPHFVYKWWLYVKTFCLSSNQCLGSFFYWTHAHWHHKHTLNILLNCLVHCNMNWVFLLQSRLKPLYFSLSSVYVQMNRVLSCNFDLNTVQHGNARPAVYMISRVFERVDML